MSPEPSGLQRKVEINHQWGKMSNWRQPWRFVGSCGASWGRGRRWVGFARSILPQGRVLRALPSFPEAGGETLRCCSPRGRRLWPRPPPGSCFLYGFRESTLDCTKTPSLELDCSSLVTLLLNNLQNGALPVFVREAFQVCKPDFMPSWRSCWRGRGELPLPVPLPVSPPRLA